MQDKHYDLFLEYFDAVVGRHYSSKQRARLLALLLGSHGIYKGSEEFARISDAIARMDEQNINDITDSKNYKLFCDILDSAEDIKLSAAALVEIYTRLSTQSQTRPAMSYLDWVISLRTANPKTEDIAMEIAYFEYASGNVDEAVSELQALVNDGSIVAVHHLAFIYLDCQEYKEAYYYFSLLESIYTKRLRVPAPDGIQESIRTARYNISSESIHSIDSDIERRGAEFPLTKTKGRVTVGFLSSERRFTYEY
ncbi:MAG: hypothetical protein IKW53_02165 [Clostridia bacterium]|nr:hypothetical protein [Clostridia bacterium]